MSKHRLYAYDLGGEGISLASGSEEEMESLRDRIITIIQPFWPIDTGEIIKFAVFEPSE